MVKKIIFWCWILFITVICSYSVYLNNSNDRLYEVNINSNDAQVIQNYNGDNCYVERGSIEEIVYTVGNIEPIEGEELEEIVIPTISAKIDLHVSIGQMLTKDEVFANYNGKTYVAEAKWKCLDIVEEGEQTIITFLDYSKLYISTLLPIKSVGEELLGKTVHIDCLDKEIEGTIDYVDSYCVNQEVEVKINYDNQNIMLMPGQEVEVEVISKQKEDVLIIPIEYVMYSADYDEYSVFLSIDEQGYIVQEIDVGIISDSSVEVLSGVLEEDELIMPDYEMSLAYYLMAGVE